MARNDPQIKFYLPIDLKKDIEIAAASNRRSLSAEVVARLQTSLEEGPTLPAGVKSLVEKVAAERGVPQSQVIAEGLLAGLDEGAKPVYYFHIHEGASFDSLIAVLQAVRDGLPKQARYYLDQQNVGPVPTKRPK